MRGCTRIAETWDKGVRTESFEYIFFFFKQKTAYEISACLVGSEMCIRDRCVCVCVYVCVCVCVCVRLSIFVIVVYQVPECLSLCVCV